MCSLGIRSAKVFFCFIELYILGDSLGIEYKLQPQNSILLAFCVSVL